MQVLEDWDAGKKVTLLAEMSQNLKQADMVNKIKSCLESDYRTKVWSIILARFQTRGTAGTVRAKFAQRIGLKRINICR